VEVLIFFFKTRNVEAFGRKVTTTAGHLMGTFGDQTGPSHYQSAMAELHKELRRPTMQRRIFSFAQASPTEIVRSKLSTQEIQNRALTYLPDELLSQIPEDDNVYSLFQGYQATHETDHEKRKKRRSSGKQKLLENGKETDDESPPSMVRLKKDRDNLAHRLEMMSVRKNMASSEIREIDNKIANLNGMRRIVLERLADLETEEGLLEHDSKLHHYRR
jgi:mitochondrial division protein 1